MNKEQKSHPGDAFRSRLPPACPLTCSWPPTGDLVESKQISTPNPGREEMEDKDGVRLREEQKNPNQPTKIPNNHWKQKQKSREKK